MSKQEKVMVIIAGLAIIFGVYYFFIVSPAKHIRIETGKKMLVLSKLADDITAELKEWDLTEAEAYIITQAGTEWTKDPFFEGKVSWTSGSGGTVIQAEKVEFSYTGYIELGKKRLAVINGLDYQIGESLVGESLESGEYIVQNIYPDRVVIKPKGKGKAITVQFFNEK